LRAAAARDEEAARRVLDGAGGRLELDGRLHFEDREELVGLAKAPSPATEPTNGGA
jgi:hypothetical protein